MTRGSRVTVSGRAFDQHGAVIEHDEAVDQAHHGLHGVLDDDDGDAVLRQPADDADELLGLVVAEARQRLVEQQDARGWPASARASSIRRSSPRRQLAGEAIGVVASGRPGRSPARRPACLSVGAGVHVGADDDVVRHRHARERAHDLEGAADAGCAQLVRLAPDHIAAVEQDLPGVRLEEAVEQVEDRGLACPVRPDDARGSRP